MKTDELREKYLSFFESKGCVRRPSDVLVPNDPTVLFWLENHKRQKISEEFGDFTQGDTKERLTYLVHNTFGLPFSKLDAYIEAHDIIVNPLTKMGYPSIGCMPCTTPVADGEDPRAGRWRNSTKKESGLHLS